MCSCFITWNRKFVVSFPKEYKIGQFSRNNFHFFCHILSCTGKTSKHLTKKNIGQFNHTLWPSFAQQNIFDKVNIFLRYHRIKVRKWWNSAFHHWRVSIWRYLKNLLRLSKTSFEKMSWFEYWKHAFLKVIRVSCKVLYQYCMLLR